MASGLAAALKNRRLMAGAVFFLAVLCGIFWLCSDPAVFLLSSRRGSSWVGAPEPLFLGRKLWTDEIVYFRKRFTLQALADVELEAMALRTFEARLDGRVALGSIDPALWRNPSRVSLPGLGAGPHEIFVTVLDRGGPAMLRADLRGGGAAGPDWEASRDGVHWSAAQPAENGRKPEISSFFPSAGAAFFKRLPALLSVFILAFLWSWGLETGQGPAWLRRAPSPSQWRWILLGAWGLLAVNNPWKVPLNVGFDVGAHMDYIAYVARHGRVPLASEGWQMFQSPLYYLISAPFYSILSRFCAEETTARLLRLIPLLCGAAQVELGYRILRRVYPERRDLQTLGTVLAGLFPMNLYLSQAVSNEGLCGALSAAAILAVWRLAPGPLPGRSKGGVLVAGAVLGLALLSKVTAVLLVIPSAAFLLWILAARPVRQKATGIALFLAAVVAVAGWYYLRNWVLLGRPFVGGWDPSRGMAWWQDPGFRVWGQVLGWGESLRRPVYAGCAGFWDALYSTCWLDGNLSSLIHVESKPPWDYGYMIAGAWLALLPSAALLALFFRLPACSAVKATYILGILPCYAVLSCAGFSVLMRGPCRARPLRRAWSAGPWRRIFPIWRAEKREAPRQASFYRLPWRPRIKV